MTAHRRGRPSADRSGLVRLCGLWLPARLAAAVRERAAVLSRPLAEVLAACVVVGLGAGPAIEVHPKQVAATATSEGDHAHEEDVPTQEPREEATDVLRPPADQERGMGLLQAEREHAPPRGIPREHPASRPPVALTLGPVAVAGVSAPPVPVAAPASPQATAAPVAAGALPLWLREAAARHAVPLAQLTAPREALRLTLSPIEREIDDLLAECKRRHLPYHGSRLAVRDADYRDRLLAHLGRPPEGWGEPPDDAPRQVEAAPPPAPAPDTLAARLAAAARAAGGSLSYAAQQAVADEYKTERLRERLSEGSPEDRRWQAVKANQAQRQATPSPAPRPRGSLPVLDPGGPSERLRRLRGEGAE